VGIICYSEYWSTVNTGSTLPACSAVSSAVLPFCCAVLWVFGRLVVVASCPWTVGCGPVRCSCPASGVCVSASVRLEARSATAVRRALGLLRVDQRVCFSLRGVMVGEENAGECSGNSIVRRTLSSARVNSCTATERRLATKQVCVVKETNN